MPQAESLPRISLARLPTPLERADRLSAAWGGPSIWVKRDDLTGFGVSGNKIRKLEFHLAAALMANADTIVTCGAAQSNHCRATALAAARLGLRTRLILRTENGEPPPLATGNHLLQRLAGASVIFVTPDEYRLHRGDVMEDEADRVRAGGGTAWVIPEGASDALGMQGLVQGTTELLDQVDETGLAPAAVWHAASSGGSTAGMATAAAARDSDIPLVACSIGEDAAALMTVTEAIWNEAGSAGASDANLEVTDRYVGEGYGMTTREELRLQAEATSLTGLILDPTYTGKALYGLHSEIQAGRFTSDDDVIFWHSGGGFAVFAHDLEDVLGG